MNLKSQVWSFLLVCVIASMAMVGCESEQTVNRDASNGKATTSFPQTTKRIVVDPVHPPKEGAVLVETYDDHLYGKTEVRSDLYLRHADSVSPTGWTPWHYRTAPHDWGNEPAPVRAAPALVGMSHTAMIFPSAVRDGDGKSCCGQVRLDKYAPAEVAVGQTFDYKLVATNDSSLTLHDVVVTDVPPTNFKVESATPAETGKNSWNLGTLNPGEAKTILVKGSATEAGQLVDCSTVTFVPYVCIATNVIKPSLALAKSAPADVLICDRIPTTLTVTNNGTGTARNVKINDDLPKGLVTENGESRVAINAGDLASGESKKFNVVLKASSTGKFTNGATASADGGLKAEASATTAVHQPVLTIKKTGPDKTILGRPATYEITVSNTGDVAAKDTVIEDAIQVGTLTSNSEGGVPSTGKVTWNIGTLAPAASKTVTVSLKSDNAGVLADTATAKAECAAPVSASAKTGVVGIPAILLEMVDDPDPIELGKTVTYTITLTNQGTAKDTNLNVVCTLEPTMEFVSCSGATKGTNNGDKVTFEPYGTLNAKDKVQWKVVVKAVKEGDVRFKVSITTDELKRPVEKTESTNFYK